MRLDKLAESISLGVLGFVGHSKEFYSRSDNVGFVQSDLNFRNSSLLELED